ncbi:hypothetical protein L9F63_021654, partial [Diploptera punctata]
MESISLRDTGKCNEIIVTVDESTRAFVDKLYVAKSLEYILHFKVDSEKKAIYEPTVDYYKDKYQLHDLDIV